MRTKHIILLSILVACTACTRRSNNFQDTNSNSQQVTQTQQISVPQKPIKTTPPKTTSAMSGSEIFDKYNSAVFMIYTSDGWNEFQGSGFFINSSGLAVSNYHVFEGTGVGLETVKLSNGTRCKVKEVIAKSKDYDYIIFKVDISSACNYIPISNRQHKVGEKVFAIGSPRGLENTFSSGEISQLRGNYVIQINAPIDHGSSGGALINEYGEAIGITSAGYDDSGANLNFAIDIDVIKPYIKTTASHNSQYHHRCVIDLSI